MIKGLRNYLARRRAKGANSAVTAPKYVELTPFFASIDSYVSLAEQVPLTQLPELMNAYFDACVGEIEGEGGVIDKFVGDAVVAMFGAPQPQPDHALRACVAALKSQERVEVLRERLSIEVDRWPETARGLRVRIGLHSGAVIVGTMGPPQRFNFTMMGDNVNLAARMEKGAKTYGVWTLCTEATRSGCEQHGPGRIIFRPLGNVIVKGRTAPLALFEPVALRENATEQLRECVDIFETGMGRFRDRDWSGALDRFAKSERLECRQPGATPGIEANPSTIFAKMARAFRDNPDTQPLVL